MGLLLYTIQVEGLEFYWLLCMRRSFGHPDPKWAHEPVESLQGLGHLLYQHEELNRWLSRKTLFHRFMSDTGVVLSVNLWRFPHGRDSTSTVRCCFSLAWEANFGRLGSRPFSATNVTAGLGSSKRRYGFSRGNTILQSCLTKSSKLPGIFLRIGGSVDSLALYLNGSLQHLMIMVTGTTIPTEKCLQRRGSG